MLIGGLEYRNLAATMAIGSRRPGLFDHTSLGYSLLASLGSSACSGGWGGSSALSNLWLYNLSLNSVIFHTIKSNSLLCRVQPSATVFVRVTE